MRRLLIGAVVGLLLAAPPAEAKWPKIALADGEAAIARFLEGEQRAGYSTGFDLTRCRHLSRRTVICKAVEHGVPWEELDLVGDSAWWPRAMRTEDRIVVYHPYIYLD